MFGDKLAGIERRRVLSRGNQEWDLNLLLQLTVLSALEASWAHTHSHTLFLYMYSLASSPKLAMWSGRTTRGPTRDANAPSARYAGPSSHEVTNQTPPFNSFGEPKLQPARKMFHTQTARPVTHLVPCRPAPGTQDARPLAWKRHKQTNRLQVVLKKIK